MTILPKNILNNLSNNLVTQFVKNNLESIMKAESQQFMISEEAGNHNSRNGFHNRSLHTDTEMRRNSPSKESSLRLPNAAV